jgi:asparagine synthase (glutamine-hydrolysing)
VTELYERLDDGLVAGSQHLMWQLAVAARDSGVRVLLDGLDGDTVVDHGWLLLREYSVRGEWDKLAEEARLLQDRFGASVHTQEFERSAGSMREVFGTYVWPRMQYEAEHGSPFRLAQMISGASETLGASKRRMGAKLWKQALLPSVWHRRREAMRLRRPRVRSMLAGVVEDRLGLQEVFRSAPPLEIAPVQMGVREVQRLFMAAPRRSMDLGLGTLVCATLGLETAHPFQDRRLVDYCLSLPPELSLQQGWPRYVLRKAMDGIVPPEITWRAGKADLSQASSIGMWERDGDLLEGAVKDTGWLRDYVDLQVLRESYAAGPAGDERDQVLLGKVATLALWLKVQWPDGPTAGSRYRKSEPVVADMDWVQ